MCDPILATLFEKATTQLDYFFFSSLPVSCVRNPVVSERINPKQRFHQISSVERNNSPVNWTLFHCPRVFFQTNFHHSVHYIFHAHVNEVIFPVAVPFVAINSNYPFICRIICGINVPCNFSPILKALFGSNGWKLIFRMTSITSTNLQKIMLLRKDIAWIWRDWKTNLTLYLISMKGNSSKCNYLSWGG